MTPRDFCYWLQGHFELNPSAGLTPEQARVVQQHLALVFKHEIDTPDPSGVLQEIHDGVKRLEKPAPPPTGKPTVYRC